MGQQNTTGFVAFEVKLTKDINNDRMTHYLITFRIFPSPPNLNSQFHKLLTEKHYITIQKAYINKENF